jgi:hypothetical protein
LFNERDFVSKKKLVMKTLKKLLATSLLLALCIAVSTGQDALESDETTNHLIEINQFPEAPSYMLYNNNLNIGDQDARESFFQEASTPIIAYTVNYEEEIISNDVENWDLGDPAGGTPLFSEKVFSTPLIPATVQDLGPLPLSSDLPAFAGMTVQQDVSNFISEIGTGPREFQVGNVQLLTEIYAGVGRGDATSPGALVTLNPANANSVVLGDPITPGGITGLDFDSNETLYASTIDGPSGNRTSRLVILSTMGSLVSDIGAITVGGTPIPISDISFQPGTDVLFGIRSNSDGTSLGGRLYTIDPGTGVATLVGDIGTNEGGGLAFAPNGTLYKVSSLPSALNVINPNDASVISSVPLSIFIDGLGVDPESGTLWGSQGGTGGNVYTINATTGLTTLVGNAGLSISDLAFRPEEIAPIPTLGEWGMILLVLLTLTLGVVFLRMQKLQLPVDMR